MRTLISIFMAILFIFPVFSFAEDSFIPAVSMPAQAVASGDEPPASADTLIFLDDSTAYIEGSGAAASENLITITQSGAYYLSGSAENLTIAVDTPDDKKVSLILDGVALNNNSTPCILVLAASKNVTIECVDRSVNLLKSTYEAEVAAQDGAYDAVIFSKADLKFKGTGELYLHCTGGKGVNGRDDVTLQDISLHIVADDDGLRGKDSVYISSGLVRIEAGADGIRSSNEEKEGKGVITITGGTIDITSAADALQAYAELRIIGGDIRIKTGSGAGNATVAMSYGGDFRGGGKQRGGVPPGGFDRGFGGGFGQDRGTENIAQDTAPGMKGIKSATSINITGGNITANCQDDAIHSDQDLTVSGGKLTISSGDDGIHAEKTLLISGGIIDILQSYEGLEAADLQIAGGEIHLNASDDGINAAGGEKAASPYVVGRGFGGMLSTSSGTLKMDGGYVVVQSEGDGVDVNGDASLTNGTLIVYGPERSGNAAMDYDGTFSVEGGTLLAVGPSGMAQSVTGNKNTHVLAFTCRMPENTLLHIEKTSGEDILTFSAPKSYSCVVFASSLLSVGETYNIYAQGTHDAVPADGIYPDGSYQPGTLLGSLSL